MRWSRPVKIGSGADRPGRPDPVPVHPGRTEDTAAAPNPIVTPERVLTLTDGVVAIALTLLVLDLTSIDVHGSSVDGCGGHWTAKVAASSPTSSPSG